MQRVLVVDDHPLMQAAIVGLLQHVVPGASTVVCASVAEALAWLESGAEIDAAVLDLHLPDGLADHILQGMRGRGPVLVLSASEDAGDAQRVLSHGAHGYCVKSASHETLTAALQQVLRGEVYLPPMLWQARPPPPGPLTERQLEVLHRLAEGLPNKRIAAELGVAEQTVKVHVGAIFRALGVANRTQAARAARAAGLLND